MHSQRHLSPVLWLVVMVVVVVIITPTNLCHSPTGVEFAAELYDFLEQDVRKDFPDVNKYVKVTLVEGSLFTFTTKKGLFS